jgi:hypothetical protein
MRLVEGLGRCKVPEVESQAALKAQSRFGV